MIILLGLTYTWTDVELSNICGLSAEYRADGYLEVMVDWNAPDSLAGFLAHFIRIEGFSFHDESGQFAYNNQLYAVVWQEVETNFLQTLDADEKKLTAALGSTLSGFGLFPVSSDSGDRQRCFLYCGITYTGHTASAEVTGPYVVELTYSVLGVRRTVRQTTDIGR